MGKLRYVDLTNNCLSNFATLFLEYKRINDCKIKLVDNQ